MMSSVLLIIPLILVGCHQTVGQNKVFTIKLKTEGEATALRHLSSNPAIEIWGRTALNQPTNVMVGSDGMESWKSFIQKFKIEDTVNIPDVSALLKNEAKVTESRRKLNYARKASDSPSSQLDWENYYNVEEIYAWLDKTVKECGGQRCTLQEIGKSHEGRPLKVLKIGKPGGGKTKKKKAVFIDAMYHAREWITTSFVTYMIKQLVSKPTDHDDLLESLDFYILPLVNPDGYAFSHADISKNRLWRKNRAKNLKSKCIGVDLNRNFGFHWREANETGEKNPCSGVYAEPTAFSELETRAIRDFITGNAKNVNWHFYYTLHSYGNCWTTSYSYKAVLPTDDKDLQKSAKCGTEALRAVHGTNATFGNSAKIMGSPLAGVSDDWAKGAAGFKYATTIELRDGGKFGFVLPADQIKATVEEAWAGLRVALTECRFTKKAKKPKKS